MSPFAWCVNMCKIMVSPIEAINKPGDVGGCMCVYECGGGWGSGGVCGVFVFVRT